MVDSKEELMVHLLVLQMANLKGNQLVDLMVIQLGSQSASM
jgi:hypothetical protein